MRALVSVYDKTGIVDFCKKLQDLNIEIVSTGGTGKILAENNISFTPVEKITGNKEAFGGRMKTISFEMSSAILFRRDHENDQRERAELGITPIDIVVCNLYAFHEAVAKNSPLDELIELIDVGGPTMVRAAAKNYKHVSIVTDPSDYDRFAKCLLENNTQGLQVLNRELSLKAFAMTAAYDLSIHNELSKRFQNKNDISLGRNEKVLRYGENPHQKAKIALFNNTMSQSNVTLANAPVLQGKEISYNNYLDSDAAFKCVSELKWIMPHYSSVVIVKHGTPCGLATSKNMMNALIEAWEADNISAFGGIIACSEIVTKEFAAFFEDKFIEVLIAPGFEKEALDLFMSKKNLRLIQVPLKQKEAFELTMRSINGGILIQDEDEVLSNELNYKLVTQKDFTEVKNAEELIYFGQTAIKYLKSNCLLLAGIKNEKEGLTFVIKASGVGQPNRLECLSKLIKSKIEGNDVSSDILFSDAFFPFSDSIEAANQLGIRYIIQPGGSIKDKDVIAKCNELNMAMKLSGSRHFRH